MCSVADMPGLFTAPSVTFQSRSEGCGRVIVRLPVKALCARRKASLKSSVQEMPSCDDRPAIAVSKGASTEEQLKDHG